MAQVKISQLPTASDLGSSDALPIIQGGVTKKLSGASMASFVDNTLSYEAGTYTVRCVGSGYTTGTSGTMYIFPHLPKMIPSGATVTFVSLTTVTIRCAAKIIASSATLTTYVTGISAYNRWQLNIHIDGLTNNFTANSPLHFIGTVTFTIS